MTLEEEKKPSAPYQRGCELFDAAEGSEALVKVRLIHPVAHVGVGVGQQRHL